MNGTRAGHPSPLGAAPSCRGLLWPRAASWRGMLGPRGLQRGSVIPGWGLVVPFTAAYLGSCVPGLPSIVLASTGLLASWGNQSMPMPGRPA